MMRDCRALDSEKRFRQIQKLSTRQHDDNRQYFTSRNKEEHSVSMIHKTNKHFQHFSLLSLNRLCNVEIKMSFCRHDP